MQTVARLPTTRLYQRSPRTNTCDEQRNFQKREAREHAGLQVHALYVLPADGTDEQLDQLGTIEGSVRSWNAWFASQTGGKELRLDTFGGCLDVTFLRVNKTNAELAAAGMAADNPGPSRRVVSRSDERLHESAVRGR